MVHLIAMKPIVLGGLATALKRPSHTVIHMTGLGFLAISDTGKARVARSAALKVMRGVMRRQGSWLLVENPEDVARVRAIDLTALGKGDGHTFGGDVLSTGIGVRALLTSEMSASAGADNGGGKNLEDEYVEKGIAKAKETAAGISAKIGSLINQANTSKNAATPTNCAEMSLPSTQRCCASGSDRPRPARARLRARKSGAIGRGGPGAGHAGRRRPSVRSAPLTCGARATCRP